ncbi:MAG TPA: CoA pyrophosphatase [Acidimicrobiales bacterium]|nr:CoA pyrophosphatase [Acidimicrobiales bacterium]
MAQNPQRPNRFVGHLYPQVIPDPGEVEAGAPAPWAHLQTSSRSNLSLAHVATMLRSSARLLDTDLPPDQPAELTIVADGPPVPITRRSAVLAALFEEDGECRVILTRRALSLRHHKGEIALPGGRCDEHESAVETALREAHEEVGLEPSLVTPLAWLSPLATFASSSAVWPVVGTLANRPTFTINEAEVDRVFTVALKDLAAEGAFVEERWRRSAPRPGADPDGSFAIYFFKVPGDVIWGATARVLTELLCHVTGVPWPAERGL